MNEPNQADWSKLIAMDGKGPVECSTTNGREIGLKKGGVYGTNRIRVNEILR